MPSIKKDLAELYDDVGQQLFHCALAVTTSSDLAEDAVHNAFTKALQLAQSPDNLKAYMFRAVRNSAVDISRKQSRHVQANPEQWFEVGEATKPNTPFDLEAISSAIGDLPDDQRETVLEHLVAGLTFREIAELRDRPIGTIATWYRRGIEKLRSRFDKHYE